MSKHVVFLNGPIGAGKTTLGRAAAERLGGRFLDGDDFADPDRPWYASLPRTVTGIYGAVLQTPETVPVTVVAYPLNCVTWIYFRRRLAEAGKAVIFISLRASYEAILDPRRGRLFDADERERIGVMLAEGYAERPFSDLILDTDRDGFEATAVRLAAAIRSLIGPQNGVLPLR